MSTRGVFGRTGPKPRGFWTQVAFGPDCWEWGGARFPNGYGRTRGHVAESTMGAHVRSWEQTHQRLVPFGQLVMHRCDNKPCVRPSHLRLGTPADNLADMSAKGRSLRGERNHAHRLTPADVRLIRIALGNGVTKADLARTFRVSESAIRSIADGTTWGWVG